MSFHDILIVDVACLQDKGELINCWQFPKTSFLNTFLSIVFLIYIGGQDDSQINRVVLRSGTFHKVFDAHWISFGIETKTSVSATRDEIYLEVELENRQPTPLMLTVIPEQRRLALHIVEGEFLGPYGMCSVSKIDRIHWDLEDVDWGVAGNMLGRRYALPSFCIASDMRTLSRELRMNPNTAHKVVMTLVSEGLLEVKPWIGTLVARSSSPTRGQRSTLLN